MKAKDKTGAKSDRAATKESARASRRRFTKTAAVALVAAPLASKVARAQTPRATPNPSREATAPPNPQPSPQQPQPPSPVALAYTEVARARFGEHLTPEELARVRRDFQDEVRTWERLRAVALKNSDEPDFIFRV